jgi:hypothetical protein
MMVAEAVGAVAATRRPIIPELESMAMPAASEVGEAVVQYNPE